MSNTTRHHRRFLLAFCALLVSGCGLTGDRQVYYPKGARREVEARNGKGTPPRPPILKLGVDDRPKTFPSTLAD